MDNKNNDRFCFKLTPIALAIGAMGFAASPMVFAANGASAATDQTVNGAAQSTNATAAMGGDAFAGAHGNVGLNEASGAGNVQANTLAVVGP